MQAIVHKRPTCWSKMRIFPKWQRWTQMSEIQDFKHCGIPTGIRVLLSSLPPFHEKLSKIWKSLCCFIIFLHILPGYVIFINIWAGLWIIYSMSISSSPISSRSALFHSILFIMNEVLKLPPTIWLWWLKSKVNFSSWNQRVERCMQIPGVSHNNTVFLNFK